MDESIQLRTLAEVHEEFAATGVSISEWARSSGFSVPLVYAVLQGRRKGLRGQSHRIAVALGLKAGRIARVEELFSATGPLGLARRKEPS